MRPPRTPHAPPRLLPCVGFVDYLKGQVRASSSCIAMFCALSMARCLAMGFMSLLCFSQWRCPRL
jgi:hypothetical protein